MKRKIIAGLFTAAMIMALAACSGQKTTETTTQASAEATTQVDQEQQSSGEVTIDYGTSELYTKEDMDAALQKIQDEFANWKGCEMHNIRYASDDCNSEENIKWVNDLKEGKNYTQCIQFYTDFHSPTEEADLEGTAWEPDQEYKDYQWTLARVDGGEWELITWGY